MLIADLLVVTADDCGLHLIAAERKSSILYLLNSEWKNHTWLYKKVCLESVNNKMKNQKDVICKYM